MSLNGYALNIEEKAALQCSLLILQQNNHFHTVHYWGKIQGIQNDYHIAEGFRGSMIGDRVKFYSIDGGITWNQMTSELTPYEVSCIESIGTLFLGIPTHTYVFEKPVEPKAEQTEEEVKTEPKDEKKEDEEDGNKDGEDSEAKEEETKEETKEEEEKKPEKAEVFTITEEKRLTWVVSSIDDAGSVVPRGAYVIKKDDEKLVVRNCTFTGFDQYQATKLYNFVHLRTPTNKTLENIVAQKFVDTTLDFADPVDDDIPYGCWSVQYEDLLNVAVGRSLLWPGYVFYHQLQTSVFGSYYVGNGMKNVDLCFMLP